MICLGQHLLRRTYPLTAIKRSSFILLYLSKLAENDFVAEQTELYVELIVAQMAIRVPEEILQESYPTSMHESISQSGLGTQRVFPLFAMIWSKTLVAIDWNPFLLHWESTITWVSISLDSIDFSLMDLYCVFRLLGITIMQMLCSFFMQFSSSFSMLGTFGLPLISYILKLSSTEMLVEVVLNVFIMKSSWTPLKQMIPTSILCLAAKMGLLNKLKKASFPLSTAFLRPNSKVGVLMILAFILSISLLSFIPIPSSSFNYLALLSLFINPPISLYLSIGPLMVASDIFFLLNSSKSSGIPVIRRSSGINNMTSSFFLPSTATNGCLSLLMLMPYFFLQQSGMFMAPSGVSKVTELISSNFISEILWQTVFPQFDMTVCPMRFSLRIILLSSLSLSL